MLFFDSDWIDHWNELSEGSGEPPYLMLQSKARNFSERCSSLRAQFRSNEVETLWSALHEVQKGWSDGLSDCVYAARAKILSPLPAKCHAIPGVRSLV